MPGISRRWLLSLPLAVAALLAIAVAGLRFGAGAPAATAGASDQDAFVVRPLRPQDVSALDAFASTQGFRVVERVEDPAALRLAPPPGVDAALAVATFALRPDVQYAEPVYPMTRADVPLDPLYKEQAHYLEAVHAPEAWDVETGKPHITVAVLDTGIDVAHPDLSASVWQNQRENPANNRDDDGNGCIDDVNGCGFVPFPSDGCARHANGSVADDLGHGTFVSGIIAATGNERGMVGIARGVKIMAVKVLDCEGNGDSVSLAQGIIYAAKAGASVINVSLGGPMDSALVREAVRVAHDDYGAVLVAASGNNGGTGVAYPARYERVLAVGASSARDPLARAEFSTSGPEVDVIAVGENIVGAVPAARCDDFLPCVALNEPYAIGSGTSFAAPQVAGLAALMRSRTPDMPPDAVMTSIRSTAQPARPSGGVNWAGTGLVHMFHAVKPQYTLGVPGVTSE